MASQLIVVAHNIRSMANVGVLFRACDGAGVSELILSGYTGAPPDPRIAKIALGAEHTLAWREVREFDDLESVFAGRHVVVLEQHVHSVTVGELALPGHRDIVLVVCEELFGADDALLARADAILELPMRGSKESLNAAVAAGIAAYGIADRLWGTPSDALASRQNRPPVRDGVLTRGLTNGETPSRG
jgi:tRNA G18 (ribose-2'-O)-methylase SpoU